MALANIFALTQMQQNDFHNAQRIMNQSLESQVVQQNLGVNQQEADPIATRLTTAPTESVSGLSGVTLAQAHLQQAGRYFSRSVNGLNPDQRREINALYDQRQRERSPYDGAQTDDQARELRNRVTMEWARGNIQNSLNNNQTVDPNVNNVFTSGARYQDSQARFAEATLQAQVGRVSGPEQP